MYWVDSIANMVLSRFVSFTFACLLIAAVITAEVTQLMQQFVSVEVFSRLCCVGMEGGTSKLCNNQFMHQEVTAVSTYSAGCSVYRLFYDSFVIN
jgi:hypothetical protein